MTPYTSLNLNTDDTINSARGVAPVVYVQIPVDLRKMDKLTVLSLSRSSWIQGGKSDTFLNLGKIRFSRNNSGKLLKYVWKVR